MKLKCNQYLQSDFIIVHMLVGNKAEAGTGRSKYNRCAIWGSSPCLRGLSCKRTACVSVSVWFVSCISSEPIPSHHPPQPLIWLNIAGIEAVTPVYWF